MRRAALAKDVQLDLEELALAIVLGTMEPRVRDKFLLVVSDLRDALPIAVLAAAIESGRLAEVIDIDALFEPLANTMASVTVAGADAAAGEVAAAAPFLSLDQTGPRFASRIGAQRLRIIVGLGNEQREAIATALVDGLVRGAGPKEVARSVRASIGLTPRMTQAVINYRRALERRSADALDRRLRDRRFDGTVRRAIREDKPIPADKIDAMVSRYEQRALMRRAEDIARTETLRAIHEGQDELIAQGIEAGKLSAEALWREWHVRLDGRERDWHGSMTGQIRAWGERFESGQGNLLAYPGDSSAPASETVNCRCVLSVRLTPPPVVATTTAATRAT